MKGQFVLHLIKFKGLRDNLRNCTCRQALEKKKTSLVEKNFNLPIEVYSVR